MDKVNTDRRRSILITGAGSGIGRATAMLFTGKGWLVGCLDVNAAALDRLRPDLATDGWVRALDVTDRSELLAAVSAFGAITGGELDLLFNNAGMDAKGSFESMTWDTVVAVINVNLVAGLNLIQAALPLLKSTPASLCLSTSSASAIFGTADLAVYSATKHAIKGLTEALSVEFARHGTRAADILPGIIDTGMLGEKQRAALPKEGPLRVLPADAVADVVWAAYHGDKVHWYVPSELAEYDVEVTRAPELARDRRIQGSF